MRRSKIDTATSRFIDRLGGSKNIRKELSKDGITVDPSTPTKWRKRGIPAYYTDFLSELAYRNGLPIGENILQEEDRDIVELFEELGGCHVVAHELGSSIDTVRSWTKKGVPTYKINQLKQLCKDKGADFPRKIEVKSR